MYTVWTTNPIDDDMIVLADIPTRQLADNLAANLQRIYQDDRARVDEE